MKGIYKITNNLNGKVYIGQSVDIEKRWKQHLYAVSHGHKTLLYVAMRRSGVENWSFEVVEETEDLDIREVYWIEWYKHHGKGVYNWKLGGQHYMGEKKDPNYVSPYDRRIYNELKQLRLKNQK